MLPALSRAKTSTTDQPALEPPHLVRACVRLLCESEEAIVAQAERVPPLHRPANGDLGALAEFEEQVAAVVRRALEQGRGELSRGR